MKQWVDGGPQLCDSWSFPVFLLISINPLQDLMRKPYVYSSPGSFIISLWAERRVNPPVVADELPRQDLTSGRTTIVFRLFRQVRWCSMPPDGMLRCKANKHLAGEEHGAWGSRGTERQREGAPRRHRNCGAGLPPFGWTVGQRIP